MAGDMPSPESPAGKRIIAETRQRELEFRASLDKPIMSLKQVREVRAAILRPGMVEDDAGLALTYIPALCHTVEELVEALREQLSASWPPQPSTHPYPRHLEKDFQRYIAARGRAEALLAKLDRKE